MILNVELLEALYCDTSFEPANLFIKAAKIYRANFGKARYYRTADGKMRISLTTFLHQVQTKKESVHLDKWREQMIHRMRNPEDVDEYVQATADFGTAYHIACAELVRKGKISELDMYELFVPVAKQTGWKEEEIQSAFEQFKKDMLCIARFFYERRVVVKAVELPCFDDLIATCVDLVVEMDEKNYDKTPEEKRKRISAIINIKTGRSRSAAHDLQMSGEKRLFNALYGELLGNIENCFIFHANDFKGAVPTYTLTKVDSLETDEIFEAKIQLAKAMKLFDTPKKPSLMIVGEIVYGEDPCNAISVCDFESEFSNGIQFFELQKSEQKNQA